jgi:hypothetical protein
VSYFITYSDSDGTTHKRQPVGRWNTRKDAERMAQRLADSGCADVELYEEQTVATLLGRFRRREGRAHG